MMSLESRSTVTRNDISGDPGTTIISWFFCRVCSAAVAAGIVSNARLCACVFDE